MTKICESASSLSRALRKNAWKETLFTAPEKKKQQQDLCLETQQSESVFQKLDAWQSEIVIGFPRNDLFSCSVSGVN